MEQAEDQSQPNPADRPLVTFDANIVIAVRNNEPNAQPARQLLALNRAGIITVNVNLSTALEKQRLSKKLDANEYVAWLEEQVVWLLKQGVASDNIFTDQRKVVFQFGAPPDAITLDADYGFLLEEAIHRILFPNMASTWHEYRDQECVRLGIVGAKRKALIELDDQDMYLPYSLQAPAQLPTPALGELDQTVREEARDLHERLYGRWMNAKNDAMVFYIHITRAAHTTHPDQAIFVTNDKNFYKESRQRDLRKLGIRDKILRPAEAIAFILKVTGASLP
ncbi:MAG: hypothetical protein ACJ788_24085 [Ktedonobacteraceae bacterium]